MVQEIGYLLGQIDGDGDGKLKIEDLMSRAHLLLYVLGPVDPYGKDFEMDCFHYVQTTEF